MQGRDDLYEATNPMHGLRISFTESGARIAPQGGAAWQLDLTPQLEGARLVGVEGNRVEVSFEGSLTGSYVNDKSGLRQSFTVADPSQIGISLSAAGLAPRVLDETTLGFFAFEGQQVLSYSLLGARDAADNMVPIKIEFVDAADGTTDVTLHVVEHLGEQVIYPVTIDLGVAAYFELKPIEEPPPRNPLLPQVAPPNDLCGGAEVVGVGLSGVTADITDATTVGDPPLPSCQGNISRSIWYTFTPGVTNTYTISTCAVDNGGTASTVDDTVIAIYTSSTGACGGVFTEIATGGGSDGCDDDTCGSETLQSILSTSLTAGTKYFIVVSKFDVPAPTAGNTAVQLRITVPPPPPANDTCAAPVVLSLDTPVVGTNQSGVNDYELAGGLCFTGVGQTVTTAPGRDVVYTFTAPVAGSYSFRTTGYTGSPALYVASTCPPAVAGIPQVVATCIGAANRAASAEEVMCLPLLGAQQVFIFPDDTVAANAGSTFTVEVNLCDREVEANNTPATANPLSCKEGSIGVAGDADFFSLGTPAAGSRIFAMADGIAGNSNDFDMRITTPADTLQLGDAALDTPFGSLSPAVAGTVTTGSDTFIRMSHFNAATIAEPYRLYPVIQPPIALATPESEPDDSAATANSPAAYSTGTIPLAVDLDFYRFNATAGELIVVQFDSDPNYDGVSIDGTLALFDSTGLPPALVTVNDAATFDPPSVRAPVLGSLVGTTPTSPSEGLAWRARYTGVYYVRVSGAPGAGIPGQEYALSISKNCQTPPTDLSVVKVDAPDPVGTGQALTYTITITNNGPGAAQNVTLNDATPPGTTFVSLVPDAAFICATPPAGGTGAISCTANGLRAGASAVFTLTVRTDFCLGDGFPIGNTATVSSSTVELNPANNASNTTTTVSDTGACDDGLACTGNDHCEGLVCVGDTEVDVLIHVNKTPVDATIDWSDDTGPGPYNVYRGINGGVAWTYNHVCFDPGVVGTSSIDLDPPPPPSPGGFYYYLISREILGCPESGLGTDSSGGPRPNAAPCP